MKTIQSLLVASCVGLSDPSLFAQGGLTPPGTPAPTMLTLEQIEPRTPISSAPNTITNSGSYYLTTNLTVASGNAININTSCVTLDLSEFTITSTASQLERHDNITGVKPGKGLTAGAVLGMLSCVRSE